MMALFKSALLIAAVCLVQSLAQADSVKSTSQNSHVGYNLHTDISYLDDKLVDEAFKRKNFNNNAEIILAGQGEDMTGRVVSPSVNPFAQKSVVSHGSSLDKGDVKQNKFDETIKLVEAKVLKPIRWKEI